MRGTYKTTSGINLIYDLSKSENVTNSCVILLPGIPYNPNKDHNLTSHLNIDGYDVYQIHYDGTWGSSGIFLESNPADSVDDFISSSLNGTVLNQDGDPYKDVSIIGTSFGGGLALTVKDLPSVKAICALSPVISYKSVNNIETLGKYLEEECSEYYMFKQESMSDLISDLIISPEKQMTIPPEKIIVFAGENDPQIALNDILEFCSKNNIKLYTEPLEHITFSKVASETYTKISAFLKSKTV